MKKLVQKLNPMKSIKLIILSLLCCVVVPAAAQTKHERAIKMLTSFYKEYVFGTKPFQLDATKYCTPRFLSKLGKDYKKKLREDYSISQEGMYGPDFYNFIDGHQEGVNSKRKVMTVVHEHGNTYRVYYIEWGIEDHRLIDIVERNNSLFIDKVYRDETW